MSNQSKELHFQGNYSIKPERVPFQWTPESIEQYMKCEQDPIYFIENFIKIQNASGKEVNFKLYEYQKKMVEAMWKDRNAIFATARQAGKALTLETDIPTPTGWVKMKDLQVGNYVFDQNGQPTLVTTVSEIFNNHKCFRITFDDKSTIECDAEHLWTVNVRDNKHKQITLSTEQMYNNGYCRATKSGHQTNRYYIPNCKPIAYDQKPVNVDPYTFGVWLGDGTSAGGSITCTFDDLIEYKQNIKYQFGDQFNKSDHIYTGTLYKLVSELRQLDVVNNKHIPNMYLHNSVEVRIALLQGLMDTDGWVDSKQQHIQLSNKNQRLLDDLYQLLVGLGVKVFVKQFAKTNSTRYSFNVARSQFDLFKLSRKLDKQPVVHKKPRYTTSRSIVNIEPIESVPTKCIVVDNPEHLFLAGKQAVPTHNSTVTCAFILWFVLFNKGKKVAVLANKGDTAIEILGKVKYAFESLPPWLQQGVRKWNEKKIEFENKSAVIAGTTTKSAIRGYTINLLFIDEAAHVENWDKFYGSVYNTISSDPESKTVLVSTPLGLNHFHTFWHNANLPTTDPNFSGFKPVMVTWKDVPGRDEAWKQNTLAALNFDTELFAQEHEVEFLGSSGTLIAGWKLKQMVANIALLEKDGLRQYFKPEPHHRYALIADVSRGRGLDDSAFSVIDVTTMPYKQVCSFNNNLVLTAEYASIIFQMAKHYNDALVLVESNDLGAQVCDILHDEYEYTNMVFTENAGAGGKRISQGFAGKKLDKGVRTTSKVKNVGCSLSKMLIEQNQLQLNDKTTIEQFKTFSKKNKSYEAESGKKDDLVMGIVLFSWMTDQAFFKEYTDINTIVKLREKTEEQLIDELVPFGMINDGSEIDSESLIDGHCDPDRYNDDRIFGLVR